MFLHFFVHMLFTLCFVILTPTFTLLPQQPKSFHIISDTNVKYNSTY